MDWSVTTWWLIAATLLGLSELLVGTFYLLLLSLGALCAATASYLGVALEMQCLLFSVVILVGGIALARFHARRKKARAVDPADDLDVGQCVTVKNWKADETAEVSYRGALWQAVAAQGTERIPGVFKIEKVDGPRLVLTDRGVNRNRN